MQPPMQPPHTGAPSKTDEEQLDLLGILYWVYGGFVALIGITFGLFGIIPAIMISADTHPQRQGDPSPLLVGGMFALIFGSVALLLIAKAVTMIFVGRSLRARSGWMFCFVGAALCVMNFPLGTALAVFTFMMLVKPEMKRRFGVA